MSRFANPEVVKRFVLSGGCQCPGTPHDEDWMDFRVEMTTADVLIVVNGGDQIEQVIQTCVGWNLIADDSGEVAPLDREHVSKLYGSLWAELGLWFEKNVSAKPLPNASGARSANGSQASASRVRPLRKTA